MKENRPSVALPSETKSIREDTLESSPRRVVRRRSFLHNLGAAAAALPASALFAAQKDQDRDRGSKSLTRGDVAILRLLAAAEIIEADLWQQYAELGGVTNGAQNSYQLAFQFLDGDASQYITSNSYSRCHRRRSLHHQPKEFLQLLLQMADEADAARREL